MLILFCRLATLCLHELKIMLIIFDFDGVLRNISWQGMFEAYIEILRFKGKDYNDFFPDLKSFQEWFDSDYKKNLNKIVEIRDDEFHAVNAIYHSYYDHRVDLFPWVKDLLQELSSRHTLALLSSSTSLSVKKSLGDLTRLFPMLLGSDHVKEIKPDPEGVHLILEKLKIPQENTLIIGDTEADILAGQAAGIKTGAVKWGGITPWETLLDLKPDYVFYKPDELFSL